MCSGHLALMVCALGTSASGGLAPHDGPPRWIAGPDDSFTVRLAVREVRRYLYATGGPWVRLLRSMPPEPSSGPGIFLARLGDSRLETLMGRAATEEWRRTAIPSGSFLRSIDRPDARILVIAAADDAGLLRGAYRFAELRGVRFSPAEDIIPDAPAPAGLPSVDEARRPCFAVRGLFPYHSGNAMGPEYWDRDDHLKFFGQCAKMGLDTVAMLLHHRGDGSIEATWTPEWEEPYRIADAPFGMDLAFAAPHHRRRLHEAMPSPDQKRALSDRQTAELAEVFSFGRAVGVEAVMGGFLDSGVDHWTRALRFLAEHGFAPRAIWQHTYENWLYSDPDAELVRRAVQGFRDFLAARDALGLKTPAVVSGWTVGPRRDPLLFHRELPTEVVIAPQIRDIGRAPVDPNYALMGDRPRWVVPWLEDDFNMIAPQLWVRRTLENLRTGRTMGATGCLATHWRVRAIEPTAMAFSQAGWNPDLTTEAFYADYCRAAFGPEAGPCIARILAAVDSRLPRPTDWKDGWPGGIHPDPGYWARASGDYAFVAQLEDLRPLVRGEASRDRFDNLLGRLKYLRALGRLRTVWGSSEEDLVLREAYRELLQVARDSGDQGDLIFLNRQVARGKPKGYEGQPNLLVRTLRTMLFYGEPLQLRAMVIAPDAPGRVFLRWRPMGGRKWRTVDGVRGWNRSYELALPPQAIEDRDFEVQVVARWASGRELVHPAGRPATIVVVRR
jgi:hypothetical protein